jgi:DNA repair protein RecO (recombination protein O)
MLHKTKGIVFRFIKYGDTSIIVSIFTEVFGLQTYIVNGVRTKSAKGKMALYQPLTLLDMVVYHKENATILRIKEIQCTYHYQSIFHDIKKSTIAMFLNEMINKSVKEQSHTEELCQFFFESFEILDKLAGNYENFHIVFLIRMSRYLGFGPQNAHEILSGRMLDSDGEEILQQCMSLEYGEPLRMTHMQRRNLMDALVRFYRTHIENFGEVKSIQVLREVLE